MPFGTSATLRDATRKNTSVERDRDEQEEHVVREHETCFAPLPEHGSDGCSSLSSSVTLGTEAFHVKPTTSLARRRWTRDSVEELDGDRRRPEAGHERRRRTARARRAGARRSRRGAPRPRRPCRIIMATATLAMPSSGSSGVTRRTLARRDDEETDAQERSPRTAARIGLANGEAPVASVEAPVSQDPSHPGCARMPVRAPAGVRTRGDMPAQRAESSGDERPARRIVPEVASEPGGWPRKACQSYNKTHQAQQGTARSGSRPASDAIVLVVVRPLEQAEPVRHEARQHAPAPRRRRT